MAITGVYNRVHSSGIPASVAADTCTGKTKLERKGYETGKSESTVTCAEDCAHITISYL